MSYHFKHVEKKPTLFQKFKNLFSPDKKIETRGGKLLHKYKTPAAYMEGEYGYHTVLWFDSWKRYTKNDGVLTWPDDGSFNVKVLRNLREKMNALVPKPRPTQFEALVEWEDEMYQLQREASGIKRPSKNPPWRRETHEDRLRMWRQGNMSEGLYLIQEMVMGTPTGKSMERESEDAVMEEIYTTARKNQPLRPPRSWSTPVVSTETSPSAPPINEAPKLYPNNCEVIETPRRPEFDNARNEGRHFTMAPRAREAPKDYTREARNVEDVDYNEYLRSKEELIKRMTKGMEAVTVPVTIGPIQPVFDQKETNKTGLTIPLNTEIQKAAEKFYSDLSEINSSKSRMPDLTFNEDLSPKTPMGAISDIGSPEVRVTTPKLDVAKLKANIEELIIGTIGPDSLNYYRDDELLFICKSIQWKTKNKYDQLEDLAAELEIDVSKQKNFAKHYRLDFSESDIESLNSMGRIVHIKDLIVYIKKLGELNKWRVKWTKKKEDERLEKLSKQFPMREIAGGGYVHVPWSRQDILLFTNDFPKLREKPVEWYRQVDRFIKVSKVLWIDLDGFFDIVVPSDLWTECKISIKVFSTLHISNPDVIILSSAENDVQN
ncbi:uncharacterized protein LOC144773844 [Lissotriton helveticus]